MKASPRPSFSVSGSRPTSLPRAHAQPPAAFKPAPTHRELAELRAALKVANERIAVLEKRGATQERAIEVATDLAQAGARKIAAMRKKQRA